MNKYFIYLYPHSENKSFKLEIPNWLFLGVRIVAIILFFGLIYTNISQILIKYKISLAENENIKIHSELALSSKIMREYSINYSKKQKYLEQELAGFLIKDNQIKKIVTKNIFNVGIGGKGTRIRNSKLIDSYGENLVDQKLLAFGKKENFSQIIEQDILSMDESLARIQNLNFEFEERKNLLASLPLLWPVKKGKGIATKAYSYNSNQQKNRITISLDAKEEIITTARGKIKQINKISHNKYSVIIKHDFGFITCYFGLQNVKVKINDLVEKGDVIGEESENIDYQIQMGTTFLDPNKFNFLKY